MIDAAKGSSVSPVNPHGSKRVWRNFWTRSWIGTPHCSSVETAIDSASSSPPTRLAFETQTAAISGEQPLDSCFMDRSFTAPEGAARAAISTGFTFPVPPGSFGFRFKAAL